MTDVIRTNDGDGLEGLPSGKKIYTSACEYGDHSCCADPICECHCHGKERTCAVCCDPSTRRAERLGGKGTLFICDDGECEQEAYRRLEINEP